MKPFTIHPRRNKTIRGNHVLRFEALEDRCVLDVSLVADINVTGMGGDPTQFTVVGNTAFFAAFDVSRGIELWKTNGTAAGTKFVKDIYAGTTDAYPNSSEPLNLTGMNGTLFFTAFHPNYGRELWKTNGSDAGTILVKDIQSGAQSSFVSELTPSSTVLYFSAYDSINGFQLWKTDGTAGGTAKLTSDNFGASPRELTDVNGTLYFAGDAAGTSRALYRVTSGTFNSVPIPLSGAYSIEELENVGGLLYFTTRNTAGDVLWRTDGVTTTQVASTPAGFENRIASLTNVNGVLYATVGATSLYKYDAGKISLLSTITPGNIQSLTVTGNKLFFEAVDEVHGWQLWVTSGTQDSTRIVKIIGAGTSSQSPRNLTNVNGLLYFSVDDGISGRELWKSDGTATGTKMVEDLVPGAEGSNPSFIINFNGRALFQALDTKKGSQVFKSNGTAAGTFRISTLNPSATADAFPSKITDVGGVAYFFADDGIHGRELWKSDGTAAGTALVKDISPGAAGSQLDPRTYDDSVNVNGTLYFVANDGRRGAELWKSNASGTSLVKNINPGEGSSNPANLTAVGGLVYFTADDGVNGVRLWKSNGTASGTVPLGPPNANPSSLTEVGGTLFFSATDPTRGTELWKTNGTPSGTVVVRDIKSGSSSSVPRDLVNVNGTLFFTADDGLNGRQLWKTNGMAAGTEIVKTITPGNPVELTNVNGTLFFSATDGAGTHLWKSDGTSDGTERVLGANPPSQAQFPSQLTIVSGNLFFLAGSSPDDYFDLWVSDGSAGGTVLVSDAALNPGDLTAAGSTLYFIDHTWEGEPKTLWKSDGTDGGTVKIQDFGNESYPRHYPGNLTSVGGRLFFSAGDLQHGNELYVVDESAGVSAPAHEEFNNWPTQPTRRAPVRRTSFSATGSVTNNLNDLLLGEMFASKPPTNAITNPRSESDPLPDPAAAIDAVFSGLPFDRLFERGGILDSRTI